MVDKWGWGSPMIPVLNFGYFPQPIIDEINNITEEFLTMCTVLNETWQFMFSSLVLSEGEWCGPQWVDSRVCYPPTREGNMAIIPCILGPTGPENLTVSCMEDGRWEEEPDLSQCQDRQIERLELSVMIYLAGYSISLVFLIGAVALFSTFSATMLSHINCLMVGWLVPLLIMIAWTSVRVWTKDISNINMRCPFIKDHSTDLYLYQLPIASILLLNTFFLVKIMRTVLEKLRVGGTEEVEGREYKAAKALVVVFPLLGVTYILTLVGPSHNLHPLSHQIFQTIRVSLLSTQVLLTRWRRWRLVRDVHAEYRDHCNQVLELETVKTI